MWSRRAKSAWNWARRGLSTQSKGRASLISPAGAVDALAQVPGHTGGSTPRVSNLTYGEVDLRIVPDPVSSSRPGGTVNGPTLFTLADAAAYVATLSTLASSSEVANAKHDRLLAVTTGASIDFLRKPKLDWELVARAAVVKRGSRLVVVSVRLLSVPQGSGEEEREREEEAGGQGEGQDDEEERDILVATATLTYSVPPLA